MVDSNNQNNNDFGFSNNKPEFSQQPSEMYRNSQNNMNTYQQFNQQANVVNTQQINQNVKNSNNNYVQNSMHKITNKPIIVIGLLLMFGILSFEYYLSTQKEKVIICTKNFTEKDYALTHVLTGTFKKNHLELMELTWNFDLTGLDYMTKSIIIDTLEKQKQEFMQMGFSYDLKTSDDKAYVKAVGNDLAIRNYYMSSNDLTEKDSVSEYILDAYSRNYEYVIENYEENEFECEIKE